MLLICYKNCSTCGKAKRWLDSHDISYTYREIVEDVPTPEELERWHAFSGLPLRRFFNTSGRLYREQGLKDIIPTLSPQEQYQRLASDGLLIRRPLVVQGDTVLVGFKEEEWEKALLNQEG